MSLLLHLFTTLSHHLRSDRKYFLISVLCHMDQWPKDDCQFFGGHPFSPLPSERQIPECGLIFTLTLIARIASARRVNVLSKDRHTK